MNPAHSIESHSDIENTGALTPTPVPAKKPRVWTVFAVWFGGAVAGTATMVIASVMVGMGMGLVMGAQGVDAATIQAKVMAMFQQPLVALLMALVPFQVGMLLVALLAARWSKEPLKERIGLLPQSGRKLSTLRLASMAGFTFSAALATALGASAVLGQPPANVIGTAINDGSLWTLTIVSIVLSLIPAVVEEIVLRGYIQRRLLQRWSPAVAIGLSTLLFAVLHADSLQHVLAVIPLGIVTGLVAFRTNSVKPGMLLHGIHNAGVVGLGAFARLLTPVIGDEGVGMVVIGGIVVLGVAGLPAIIALLRQPKAADIELKHLTPMPVETLASQAA